MTVNYMNINIYVHDGKLNILYIYILYNIYTIIYIKYI